jgi:hypothetical protein
MSGDLWSATRSRVFVEVKPGECVLAYDVHQGWASISVQTGSFASSWGAVMHHKKGTSHLPEKLAEYVLKYKPRAIGFEKANGEAFGEFGRILEHFEAGGLDAGVFQPLTSEAYKAACQAVVVAVDNGKAKRPFVEPDQLHTAGELAAERRVGDAFVWDRRSASVPLSPLISWTIARSLLGERVDVGRPVFWS